MNETLRMNLTNLPTEIVIEVANQLSERDVARLLRVSKHLQSLLSDYLLKRNARSGSLWALAWASKHGRRSMAQRLIQYGADINHHLRARHEKLEGATVLHFATLTKCHPMVCLLLELGADPTLTDSAGRTAVYWAYMNRDEKTIRSISDSLINLHEFFVRPNHHLTPLHMACSTGLTTIGLEYIDMGLDVSARDHLGRSPIDMVKTSLTCRDLTASSSIDAIVHWTQLLVKLGEDSAAAHDLVKRAIPFIQRMRRVQEEVDSIQVGRKWFETSVVSSSSRNNDVAYKVLVATEFPSLIPTLDSSLPTTRTRQSIWSPGRLAQSVVKRSLTSNVQPHKMPDRTTSHPFPSLSGGQVSPRSNELSITAWNTFRRLPVQHGDVGETKNNPKPKPVKRRWQPVDWQNI